MKLLIGILFISITSAAQMNVTADSTSSLPRSKKINMITWKMDRNKWRTGSLVFLAGAAKGFNETLMFHWRKFHHKIPGASARWFNPAISWRNKYKERNPDMGPKFPLSTSALIMFTDQYHLNNFIHRSSWMTAIVIKIGEKKKPLKYYIKDCLFYTACNQLGFVMMYYPFTGRITK